MDSSLNLNSEIINFKEYLGSKKDILQQILRDLENLSDKSKSYLKSQLTKGDRIDNQLLEIHQFQTHGFAWFETYRIGLRETLNWFSRLAEEGKASEIDASITIFAFSEYLLQMKNGIMMVVLLDKHRDKIARYILNQFIWFVIRLEDNMIHGWFCVILGCQMDLHIRITLE